MKKSVVFLGSYMHCIFGCGKKIPQPGETMLGEDYFVDYSGKGNAQAFMCARMGSPTEYIGRLGTDSEGEQALGLFREFGLIDTSHIVMDHDQGTGIAIILTDAEGQNAIMSIPGTNFCFTKEDIDRNEDIIRSAEWMCFVLETNQDIVEYGIKKAKALGTKIFLDPAPAAELSEDIYPCLDLIKPNEYEASVLTGIPVVDVDSAVKAGKCLLAKGVKTVVITLGGNGSVLVVNGGAKFFAAPKVAVVDTTSAGDSFGGALVSMLNQGAEMEQAVVYATCAGALATTKIKPILEVLPRRSAVEDLVNIYYKEKANILTLV